jgi:hypothetical protein
MVRPGSGYAIFNNSETQNYAVKEDHLIVYDDFQSLKEKVKGTFKYYFKEYTVKNITFLARFNFKFFFTALKCGL